MAGSEAAKEALYLSNFLGELGVSLSLPVTLGMDNQGAIDLAYNPEHHARTKHIDRRHFFIRECVEEGKLRVPYVTTTENMADFFTKPLPSKTFFYMRDAIMNVRACESTTSPDASSDKHPTTVRAQPEPGPIQLQHDALRGKVSPG